jgi:hypothetical protein
MDIAAYVSDILVLCSLYELEFQIRSWSPASEIMDDSEQLYLVHHALHSVSSGSISDTTPIQDCECRSCLRLLSFHALRTFAQYLSLTWTPSGLFAFYNDSSDSHPTSRRQMDEIDIAFFSVLSMLPTQISWISLPQTSQFQLKRDLF